MRINRRLTLGALLLAVTAACNAGGGSTQAPSHAASSGAPSTGPSTATSQAPGQSTNANLPTVKVGSVGFDEARVMAELYAQVLEANGYTVDRTGIGLGTRSVVAPAIESGQIDLQPEYIGSRISYELANSQPSGAPSTATVSSLAPSAAAASAPAASTPAGSGGITGPSGDAATNLTNLQSLLAGKNLTVLNYTPAVDT